MCLRMKATEIKIAFGFITSVDWSFRFSEIDQFIIRLSSISYTTKNEFEASHAILSDTFKRTST